MQKWFGIFLFTFFLILVCTGTGFSIETPDDSGPQKDPAGNDMPADHPANPDENPVGAITLDQALKLGLSRNPELASFSWAVRAAEARQTQEGSFPNPELAASIENFGGTKDLEGFTGAETTIEIQQTIELGGKRAKRENVAALEKDIVQWEYRKKRQDVSADISKAFWELMAAQEKFAVAGEIMAVADEAHNMVAARVKAGKTPPLDELQSKVTLTTTRIEYEQSGRALETARNNLAATWGSSRPVFEKAVADIRAITSPPPLADLEMHLSKNPDLAVWDTETEKYRAQVELAEAERIPDLTIGAGPRFFHETDDMAFVMNVTIPIPLLNRNKGGIEEAGFNLAQARESRKAALLKAQNVLNQSYQDLSASYRTADSLREIAIPAAKTIFSASLEGYREGKIGYLGVLENQRTFFEVQNQYISAISEYYQSKADIERLTGSGPGQKNE